MFFEEQPKVDGLDQKIAEMRTLLINREYKSGDLKLRELSMKIQHDLYNLNKKLKGIISENESLLYEIRDSSDIDKEREFLKEEYVLLQRKISNDISDRLSQFDKVNKVLNDKYDFVINRYKQIGRSISDTRNWESKEYKSGNPYYKNPASRVKGLNAHNKATLQINSWMGEMMLDRLPPESKNGYDLNEYNWIEKVINGTYIQYTKRLVQEHKDFKDKLKSRERERIKERERGLDEIQKRVDEENKKIEKKTKQPKSRLYYDKSNRSPFEKVIDFIRGR